MTNLVGETFFRRSASEERRGGALDIGGVRCQSSKRFVAQRCVRGSSRPLQGVALEQRCT